MWKKTCIVFIIFVFAAMANVGMTETYYVKTDGSDSNDGLSWSNAFSTITEAISHCSSGDDVWIAQGTYKEGGIINIPLNVAVYGGFEGNENDLSDRDIDHFQTIIDGENSYRCIDNYGSVDGLYIMNGNYYTNAGIYNYSSGSVINCEVFGNTTDGAGAGIFNRGEVTSCTVHGNIGTGTFSEGAGIYNYGNVYNCWIYDNTATWRGGGVFNASEGSVTSCTLHHNSSENGGGIYDIGSIDQCLIYSNSGDDGGGMSSSGVVNNCILFDNSSGNGGGIYLKEPGIANNCIIYKNSADTGGGALNIGTLNNCVIFDNYASGSGGGIYNYGGSSNDTGFVNNCIVWNNHNEDIGAFSALIPGTVTYTCYETGPYVYGHDNINQHPVFVNTAGPSSSWDFHLQNTSPCIDSGTNAGIPEKDKDGVPRPQDGDGDSSAVADMGAYEFLDAPAVEIVTPESDQLIPYSQVAFDFSGAAWDYGSVDFVQYRLNSGAWQSVTGTNFWSFSVGSLIPGDNLIEVRARDDENNFSNIKSRVVTRDNEYELTYIAGNHGSISGASPQTVLYGEDGSPVEAVPDEGYHFDQWSDLLSDNPRIDVDVTGDISVTAYFHDITLPESELQVPEDSTIAAPNVTLPFIAADAGSGVNSTELWIMGPTDASFTDSGLSETGNSGSFLYTLTAGDGLYRFATKSVDNNSNAEADPVVEDVAVIVNTSENSDFSWTLSAADEVTTFPMTNVIDIVISIVGATPGGAITVSRTTGDFAPASYNAATLLNEYLTIAGSGLGTGWTASITWNYDPASEAGLSGELDTVFQFEDDSYIRSYSITSEENRIVIQGVTSFSDWYAGDSSSEVLDWKLF